jgi:alkanesulfonate monooxygenase SsuD/methylene tetrahydromethanopterin reductase-like flavin-dependent oxidoreductase (luciferase family)
MMNFFQQPKEKISYHFTIFGTPEECVRLLEGYVEAGLTTIIARIASDDVTAQAQLLSNEIKPQLG